MFSMQFKNWPVNETLLINRGPEHCYSICITASHTILQKLWKYKFIFLTSIYNGIFIFWQLIWLQYNYYYFSPCILHGVITTILRDVTKIDFSDKFERLTIHCSGFRCDKSTIANYDCNHFSVSENDFNLLNLEPSLKYSFDKSDSIWQSQINVFRH